MRLLPNRRRLVCRQAVALMTDYLDDAMRSGDRRRLEDHLTACPHCHEYLEQLRRTIALTGRIDADTLEPAVLDELVAVYRRWVSSNPTK